MAPMSKMKCSLIDWRKCLLVECVNVCGNEAHLIQATEDVLLNAHTQTHTNVLEMHSSTVAYLGMAEGEGAKQGVWGMGSIF